MDYGDIPPPRPRPPLNGRRSLITGVTGQDGSYLAEQLIAEGQVVYGLVRRASTHGTARIDHLIPAPDDDDARLHLLDGDLTDATSLFRVVEKSCPHEVYNLAAQSDVRVSFDLPEATAEVTGVGVVRLLEALRRHAPEARFYQASTSELFGRVHETPQTESTPFHPRSPYGAAKAYAFEIVRNYRESYGVHAVNGILFNHESPRRGEKFVTRKITLAASRIARGTQRRLLLGNLDARRDWGYAKDYVEAMTQMLRAETPEDLVVATGETRSVREFCERAFARAGLPLRWRGSGTDEIGVGPDGQTLVSVDPRYKRPAEVDVLLGDATRIRETLGWRPRVGFEELVDLMVDADRVVAESA